MADIIYLKIVNFCISADQIHLLDQTLEGHQTGADLLHLVLGFLV